MIRKTLVYDGNLIAFKYFCIFKDKFKDKQGRITSILFGFMKRISSDVKTFGTKDVIVAWDSRSWKKKKFKSYKKSRTGLKEDHFKAINVCRHAFNQMGVSQIKVNGLEGDELISLLAYRIYEQDEVNQCIIVTEDKDMNQCIKGNRVVVFHPKSKDVVNELKFIAKFKMKPIEHARFLAVKGDKADEIAEAKTKEELKKNMILALLPRTPLDISHLNDDIRKKLSDCVQEKIDWARLPKAEKMIRILKDEYQINIGNLFPKKVLVV